MRHMFLTWFQTYISQLAANPFSSDTLIGSLDAECLVYLCAWSYHISMEVKTEKRRGLSNGITFSQAMPLAHTYDTNNNNGE